MEVEKKEKTLTCRPKLRADMHRILDSGGAFIAGQDIVTQSATNGKYDCPADCPGFRLEPRRIGKFVLPIFPKEICGLEAPQVSSVEIETDQPVTIPE